MITGFNTDVEHDGRTFHVQTEERGRDNPVVETLVYCGGQIVTLESSSYSDLVDAHRYCRGTVLGRMEDQHESLIHRILSGGFDAPSEAASPHGQSSDEASLDEVVSEYLDDSQMLLDHVQRFLEDQVEDAEQSEAADSIESPARTHKLRRILARLESRVERVAAGESDAAVAPDAAAATPPSVSSPSVPSPERAAVRAGAVASSPPPIGRDPLRESPLPRERPVAGSEPFKARAPEPTPPRSSLVARVLTVVVLLLLLCVVGVVVLRPGDSRHVAATLEAPPLPSTEPLPSSPASPLPPVESPARTEPAPGPQRPAETPVETRTALAETPDDEPSAGPATERVAVAAPPRAEPRAVAEIEPPPPSPPAAPEPAPVVVENAPGASTAATSEAAPAETEQPADPPLAAPVVEPAAEPPPVPPAPEIWAGKLVDAAELTIQPRPIRRELPRYTRGAKRRGEFGVVEVAVMVIENGDVAAVELVEGIAGSELNQATLTAAEAWEFTPPYKGTYAVRSWKRVRVSFAVSRGGKTVVKIED